MNPSPSTSSEPRTFGRFDQSFAIYMITHFVLFLLLVAAVELGLRFAMVLYEFHHEDPKRTEAAAERLAGDVRTIMMNRGGPTAARTVYPIVKRNFHTAGMEIAIEPSEVTVRSIEKMFDFTPRGIPAEWPEGRFHEHRVALRADDACQSCHVDAGIGDVLGHVVVRKYLSDRVAEWWEEVRLTLGINVLKILIHSVILFLLLKVLMGPLEALRAAVARLARGERGLSARATVRATEEIGALAHDLNCFLDRLEHLLEEFQRTLSRSNAVGTRLARLMRGTDDRLERVEHTLYAALPRSEQDQRDEAVRFALDLGRLKQALQSLEDELPQAGSPAARRALAEAWARFAAAEEAWSAFGDWRRALPHLVHELHDVRHLVDEMKFLQTHLDEVSDRAAALMARVNPQAEARGTATDDASRSND